MKRRTILSPRDGLLGLVLSLLFQIDTVRAFAVVTPVRSFLSSSSSSSSQLLVSVGLGPDEDVAKSRVDELVEGVDYQIPDHEAHRLDRRSKLDARCDDWIASLIPNPPYGVFDGPIAETIHQQLTTLPALVNEHELPRNDELYTPFINTELPWNILRPAYGLEAFGLPSVRRNAEAWRHADVNGLIGHAISANQPNTSLSMETIRTQLQQQGAFLPDNACDGRLVYVNGQFCPELSKTQEGVVEHLSSTETLDEFTQSFLTRLTDGFTDKLVEPVPMQDGTFLTSHQRLSEPNHNVGKPTSQFAINTQQGTAIFCALNTLAATGLSCCRIATQHTLPVQIVHATTPSAGQVHPRTLILADADSTAEIVQQSVSLEEESSGQETTTTTPLLFNGYTQVLLRDNANISHTMIEESGGLPMAGVERSDANVRAAEAARPALNHTVLETLDVHCAGKNAHYSGTLLNLGGNGRSKMASCITLLQPTSSCQLYGFSLTGGTCRSDVKTNIHHIADGCVSEQLQKSMVGGRATTSFRGRIRVEQSAQQTDSQQLSRTVLLTDSARAWAVPSLEIIADDVTCTHGATVSDLSEEELFYLQSRGLSTADARNLLMFAFCNDVLENVPESILGELKAAAPDSEENGLRMRILRKLQNLVPTGKRAVKGEFQSI